MIAIPFIGSKRNYVRRVEGIVGDGGYTSVFEPFGGSAVLSVNLLNDGLVDRAVINDYDHLFDLYPEYLDIKDEIIAKCLEFGIVKSGVKKKLTARQAEFVRGLIAEVDGRYWPLLANNFVFSARATNSLKLKDFAYFQNDITTDRQREYLRIVSRMERVSLDYKDFFLKFTKDFDERSILILDPPYLNSVQKQYSNEEFFGLAETIDALNRAKKSGSDFLFFNMVKKDTAALLQLYNFWRVEIETKHITQNYSSAREDIMAYVRRQPMPVRHLSLV